MRLTFFASVSFIFLLGCSQYDAEVGYYENAGKKWEIWGNFRSLKECRDAAIARYNAYNRNQDGRAFSWACLKKNRSGGYESRHR